MLERNRFLSRHHTPTNLLSGQATWLRCRVLDEPLATPWCRNLACNAVMWRSRPGLRSSLWIPVQCLSSARLLYGSLRIECRHSASLAVTATTAIQCGRLIFSTAMLPGAVVGSSMTKSALTTSKFDFHRSVS